MSVQRLDEMDTALASTHLTPGANGGDTPSSSASTGTADSLLQRGTPTSDDEAMLTPATSHISDGPSTPKDASSTPKDAATTPTAQVFKPKFNSPPPVKYPYKQEEALGDLPGVSYALELFLASHMLESEEYCHKSDEKKERLYFSTGFGLIQCVKGLMSYEDDDLLAAIAHTKQGNYIAAQHRKKPPPLGTRLAGYVLGSSSSAGSVNFIRGMTPMERHAELVYAESLFEKALLGIVYSGDWLAFIKEALNMRATIAIYNQLYAFLLAADAAREQHLSYSHAKSAPSSPTTPLTPFSMRSPPATASPFSSSSASSMFTEENWDIDPDFRSGVYLGVGMCNIILSMMPGKLMTLVELFGYHGDRKLGLELLMKAGGWDEVRDDGQPGVGVEEEGVRRSICDMTLLIFHLVLSSFTFRGVDISVAKRILAWNLKRYPNGVFFLFGAGRLGLCRSQPQRAIDYYTKAMESQSQYRNLHHISFWEIAIANLALWELGESLLCWRELEKEATWSKAIYSYGMAVCLLEIGGGDENMKEAARLMVKVPSLRQKIAGKSIPLEKFVARKARKFQSQNNRLSLPGLEIAYLFLGIAHAPRAVITGKMLPEVRNVLTRLDQHKSSPKKYGGGQGYWDDLCLARFLEGVCLRYVAYPDPDAELDPNELVNIPKDEAEKDAVEAFQAVFEHGPKIELDHHLVYHTHYELGRLLACQGDTEGARNQFELVLSGKTLEVGPSGKKGKYSMENALHMRTHAALDALHQKRL